MINKLLAIAVVVAALTFVGTTISVLHVYAGGGNCSSCARSFAPGQAEGPAQAFAPGQLLQSGGPGGASQYAPGIVKTIS